MCGIVGAVARRNVVPILLEGLKRLEYRGYDSAGIAVVNGKLHRVRSTGRVAQLGRLVDEGKVHGTIGIAHTRWATHGKPTEINAHPHVSEGISVVHNGIIENHEEMRARLRARGYDFTSETDSEVIAHLVHSHAREGLGLMESVRRAACELQGAYAIAVIAENDPSRMVVARMGAPLLLGLGEDEYFAASDTSALLQVTQQVIYLEEGDCAELALDGIRIVEKTKGTTIQRPLHQTQLSAESVELGAHAHYMQKEIFEQPKALRDTLELAINAKTISPQLFGTEAAEIFAGTEQVLVLACGTSHHAGLVARHWIESIAGLPCNVEIASEYRYRQSVPNPKSLVVGISQSGETADTLAALDTRASSGSPTRSPSATSRSRRSSGPASCGSSRARAPRSASPPPRPSPPSSPRCCCSRSRLPRRAASFPRRRKPRRSKRCAPYPTPSIAPCRPRVRSPTGRRSSPCGGTPCSSAAGSITRSPWKGRSS